MQPTPELIRSLLLDKIERARSMTPGQRLLAGPDLFDLASSFTRMGIRQREPGISTEQELRRLREILDRHQRLEARRSTGASAVSGS